MADPRGEPDRPRGGEGDGDTIPPKAIDRLASNLDAVRNRMARAAARAGRAPEAVRLVAVTKAVPPSVAAALVALGVPDLGENRPEQALERAARTPPGSLVRWHMIGHYQRRKVRDTLPVFALVHSVHGTDLLRAIARRAGELGRVQPVLLQINVTGERTKQGLAPPDVGRVLESAAALQAVRVDGFMTMAPLAMPSVELRRTFARLRDLRDAHRTSEHPLPDLSMGMSGDFEEAIAEGATLVRVGSALFEGVLGP